MEEIVRWAIARMREPSTYAGLGTLLVAFHVGDAQSWANNITTMAIGFAGVLAMVMKENQLFGGR